MAHDWNQRDEQRILKALDRYTRLEAAQECSDENAARLVAATGVICRLRRKVQRLYTAIAVLSLVLVLVATIFIYAYLPQY